MSARTRSRAAILSALIVAAALLGACAGEDRQPETVTWRNITVQVPDGWYVFEEEDTRLSISNADIGPESIHGAGDLPESDVVAMFFTFEPATQPEDWRRFVEQQEGTMQDDESVVLGEETPATRFVFEHVSGGTPLRELVAVIPSRGVVVLAQPVPSPGQQDGPEVFTDYRATFEQVLETLSFGPPLME